MHSAYTRSDFAFLLLFSATMTKLLTLAKYNPSANLSFDSAIAMAIIAFQTLGNGRRTQV